MACLSATSVPICHGVLIRRSLPLRVNVRYAAEHAMPDTGVFVFTSKGNCHEAPIGYSRAVVAGDWVFVSGTTGFDYVTMTISDDVVAQAEQCLQNIANTLAKPNRRPW